AAGLRLAFDSLVANGTDKTWTGFVYSLVDRTDLTNVKLGIEDSHLSVAHFHPQSLPEGADAAQYTATVFSVIQGDDNTPGIRLGSGQLDPGGEFTLNNALIHERNYQLADGTAVLRRFDLVLTPTPEPGSMTLLLLGAVGAAGYGWHRHRRAGKGKQVQAPAS